MRRTAYEMLQERKNQGDQEAAKLIVQLDDLEKQVPQTYSCNLYGQTDASQPVSIIYHKDQPLLPNMKGKGFPVVTTYRGKLADSIEAIKSVSPSEMGPLHDSSHRSQELKKNEKALQDLDAVMQANSAILLRAIEYK
jgi:hypothetical protein